MAIQARKWISGQSPWYQIQWGDSNTFKVDLEGQNLKDDDMQEWGLQMEAQLEKKFGKKKPRLIASGLNFSKNELGSDGVLHIVDFLQRRSIGAQSLKFYRNNIGDEGACAIGQFIARSHEPVHEVHLSHNSISERGACSLMETIARSQKYPYVAGTGKRDAAGMSPIWIRFEHNRVNWAAIGHRLSQPRVRWCVADSRDAWHPKDRAPMMCIHNSYTSQSGVPHEAEIVDGNSFAASSSQGHSHPMDGQDLLAALRGGDDSSVARGSLDTGVSQVQEETAETPSVEPAIEEAYPMYIFLDTSAVCWMLLNEEKLFSFKSLFSLCQNGYMDCKSEGETSDEHDRVIFVITDGVLDDLEEGDMLLPEVRERIQWFRQAQDSYLQSCRSYGILEAVETKDAHKHLIKIWQKQLQVALGMKIREQAVKNYDFACLWAAQIEMNGRVLYVSGDQTFLEWGSAVVSDQDWRKSSAVSLINLSIDELNDRFSFSARGQKLLEAASAQSQVICDSLLCASLLTAVLDIPALVGLSGHAQESSRTEAMRKELGEAMALFTTVRHHIANVAPRGDNEVSRFLGRLDGAQTRWNQLLPASSGQSFLHRGPTGIQLQ